MAGAGGFVSSQQMNGEDALLKVQSIRQRKAELIAAMEKLQLVSSGMSGLVKLIKAEHQVEKENSAGRFRAVEKVQAEILENKELKTSMDNADFSELKALFTSGEVFQDEVSGMTGEIMYQPLPESGSALGIEVTTLESDIAQLTDVMEGRNAKIQKNSDLIEYLGRSGVRNLSMGNAKLLLGPREQDVKK